jgi:hypothetical protein
LEKNKGQDRMPPTPCGHFCSNNELALFRCDGTVVIFTDKCFVESIFIEKKSLCHPPPLKKPCETLSPNKPDNLRLSPMLIIEQVKHSL